MQVEIAQHLAQHVLLCPHVVLLVAKKEQLADA